MAGNGFREHAWNDEQAEQSAHDTYVKETPDAYLTQWEVAPYTDACMFCS